LFLIGALVLVIGDADAKIPEMAEFESRVSFDRETSTRIEILYVWLSIYCDREEKQS
jgi:hypothetical protein